ncbi:MAG: ATP-binding protein [Alteromonadaceae bacterium]|nr:ATP-binding protein [Alteromonadaceae bacterium]
MIKCLEDGLLCFNDGDFSASLTEKAPKQYQHLFKLFNQTGDKLRVERQHLYHREMLLDKVLSSSPVLTILVDHRQHIVFANRAALESFKPYGLMPGQDWLKLLDKLPEEFQSALTARGEAIFTVSDENNQQQAWHVAMSSVRMHQAQHQLYLLRTITEELSKQEVATWKKVISVISHELNNSLAPISTMCHNGTLLANNLDEPRLDRVFNSISRRINHLNEFIKGYASLTKLKLPQKTSLDWSELIEHLNSLFPFKLSAPLPEKPIIADGAQLEQVLINILKNAYEADKSHKVELSIKEIANKKVKIEITDQGIGMSEEVLQNALLPFYSTKHSGTGLGLALCREIVEAHQGKMIFSNIEQGGLSVSVILPMG